ncbi:MAG: NAD(P)-dependent oxidoreductase [Thermaerobacter sp.]|nr:NAD(P)-dependent oxidoreductase [Thermaerobacter sp.]
MRIFLAGATGVIGLQLVPLLIDAGHEVAAMTRSSDKTGTLRTMGAEPVICDVFDVVALRAAVVAFRPDMLMHQLTDLPDDATRIPEVGAANNRIRREGTANLLAAAKVAGTSRFIAQSVAWPLPGDGGAAVAELERMVLAAEGVVIRYGRFYGPGTYSEVEKPEPPRIHVAEAARQTVMALDAPSGVLSMIES